MRCRNISGSAIWRCSEREMRLPIPVVQQVHKGLKLDLVQISTCPVVRRKLAVFFFSAYCLFMSAWSLEIIIGVS